MPLSPSKPGEPVTEAPLPTEQHRLELLDLDLRATSEQVEIMLDDHRHAAEVVRAASPAITAAVDAIAARLGAGDGRLVYVGAGTAGRLGLLDASEVPPTFDSERVVALLAGGDAAMSNAREAAEDDPDAAVADLQGIDICAADVVVGIAASGRTPYTLSAVSEARARGALTVGLSSNADAALSDHVDHPIEIATGPELIAGSTRLKAGTAQKIVLNTISTLVMVKLGRTFGNLMVDVRSTNAKLRVRARQMVIDATGASAAVAESALDDAGGDQKTAIVSILAGLDASTAAVRLAGCDGRVREAIGEAGTHHVPATPAATPDGEA